MKVPLLDLKAQYATIREQVRTAVDAVFESQSFILGSHVQRLEELIAAYTGCRHAIGVASGTDALLLALKALGVGPGDAVVTSSFTFFATGGAIANVGAMPVFVDIDPATFNIDPERLAEFLEGHSSVPAHRSIYREFERGLKCRTLLPVHLYGQMAWMPGILALARRHGLTVLEDAAQAIGATQRRPSDSDSAAATAQNAVAGAGTLGDAGTLSFFPSKNLGGAGDAGMVLTNRAELAEKVKLLRVHGSKPKYVHHIVGYNSRIDELQAAVLVAKFGHLEDWTQARARNAEYYRQALRRNQLEEVCQPPAVLSGNRHIYHQFVVRVPRRDALREFLAEREIATEVYYPIPLHLQQCFSELAYRQGDLPETERAARECLALPIYPELKPEQMDYVVGALAQFYGKL